MGYFSPKLRWLGAVGIIVVNVFSGCADKVHVSSIPQSDFFTQDFNPPYIDVLWVVDDRSPMQRAANHLVGEASSFFQRLDGTASQYRMEFISTDMQFARGNLKIPSPLSKGIGDVRSRTALFASTFQNIINLKTGGLTKGIEAATVALTNYFKPQERIPMVVVFISDSYDVSDLPSGQSNIVSYFSGKLLSLVGNNADLLQVYSIGYTQNGNRCATQYHSDIDVDPSHIANPYFLLAQSLNGSTADLCSNFSSTIDLSGLRLKTLSSRFKLGGVPSGSLQVIITKAGNPIAGPKWLYQAETNEIVFESAPEEGSTIQVIY